MNAGAPTTNLDKYVFSAVPRSRQSRLTTSSEEYLSVRPASSRLGEPGLSFASNFIVAGGEK
jgi:hypothetical protein